MKKIITIAGKEILSYFSSPVGYVFSGILLLVSNWLFFQDFFLMNQASLAGLWANLSFLLSIFVPALTMNSIADEKRNGNWEIILSLPVTETQLVLGKFLGTLTYILITLLFFLPTTILVFLLGKPDLGIIIGGWLGTLFLVISYLSVGIFTSALSNQPVVGFVSAMIILLLNNFIGQSSILSTLPEIVATIVGFISLSAHSNQMAAGLIQLNDIIFFISINVILLTLTVLWLKSRNK